MPEVSVIIPNYNHAPFLKERIDSVLQQTFRDFEVIILDDASTDNSRALIETFRGNTLVTHILYNEKNSGSPYRQWQKGIEVSNGRWIWIAESDDTAAPDFLQQLTTQSLQCEETALVYCDSYIKNGVPKDKAVTYAAIKNNEFNTDKWSRPYCISGKEEINETLKWQCTINNASAAIFDRVHLQEAVSSAITYRFHGDWLIYLQMAEKGKIAYIPQPLNVYRDHFENHSKSIEYHRKSKVEHFRILDYLLKQAFVTEKKKLTTYFVNRYIGFGFLKEKGLGKNGMYKQYKKINSSLAVKTLFQLLINRIKGK